jgi:UDP-N-acetylmuramoylalanine--D-glutamate ligase
VLVWDSREYPPQANALTEHVPAARLITGELRAEELDNVQRVLKSPGLSPTDERVAPLLARAAELGVPLQGELELFAQALAHLKAERRYAPKVLAITGTNGKTTTTAMTALLVERTGKRVAVAGNIGPTMLQTLAEALEREPEAEADAQQTPAPADAAETPAAGMDSRPEMQSATAAGIEYPVPAEAALDVLDDPVEVLAEEVRPADEDAADQEAAEPPATDLADMPLPAASAEASADADSPAGPPADDEDATPLVLEPPPPAEPVFEHLPEVWVLELSSFQLDNVTAFEPSAATVLNITQDHLDWHGTMDAYARAKARIFGKDAVMVINRDDPIVEGLVPAPIPQKGRHARPIERRVTRFGLGAPKRPGDFGLVTENGMTWLVRALPADETLRVGRRRKEEEDTELHIQRLMPADALRVRGRHNAANALAALALATAIGCPLAPMLHGLREYHGEPHRVEYVATVQGVDFFDDSKGTNVGATVAAINGLGPDRGESRLLMILGGDGKGQDFAPLVEPVSRFVRFIALIGRDAPAIEAALAAAGVEMQSFETLEAATRACAQRAHAGDAVLMSPACASLDMFRNYAHRAEVFVGEVQTMANEHGELMP